MRHKYHVRGIVLARASAGEAHAELAVLTDELGLVWARAAGLRRARSKLAPALATFCESELVLVRGAEGWRLAGAVLVENWFARLAPGEPRRRAARVTGLLLRLAPGEAREAALYSVMRGFFASLGAPSEALGEGAELLAAAGLLAALGLDDAPPRAAAPPAFSPEALAAALAARASLVARINRGIAASGL